MKKLLGIVVLGLLWCNVVIADVLHLKCSYTKNVRYSAFDGGLQEEVSEIDPVWEMVYSIDLNKEKMVGKNYKIWKDTGHTYQVLVFDDKIVWLDARLVKEDLRPTFLSVFGQAALSIYNYNEISRYDGGVELSMYSQEWDMGKKLDDLNMFEISKEDFKYIEKINKLAKENRNQKDNILVSTKTGTCEKMQKLEKKF